MNVPNRTRNPEKHGKRVIAVTGATGFVGRWLLARLSTLEGADGIQAVPLFGSHEGADIRNADDVSAAIRELKPAAVIHLAAVAAPADARQDPRHAWDVNVLGTLNVVLALRDHAPEARLIFVGSSEVYGGSFKREEHLPLDESAAFQPLTPYAATKAAADLMVGQAACEGLDCVRFRPFNHTGPGQTEKYAISAFARQIARIEKGLQQPVMDVGNLSVMRDFLDVRDVVRAYATAAVIEAPLKPGIALNLASGKSRQLREILDILIAMSGREIEVAVNSAYLRDGDLPYIHGDASLAQRTIGWHPVIPLEETLEAVLDDWRSRV